MYDYHIHSNFSADCKTPMEEMVKAAIAKGLKEICFTEHIDEDYPDVSIHFELDLHAYNRSLEKMRSLYGNKIAIKKGVELGVQPHVLDTYKNLLRDETFDFVICSMHATKGFGLHSGEFFAGKTLHAAYEEYYTELLHCLKSFEGYSILGHLDLVTRYKYREGVDSFLEIIEEIFRTIIPAGKGIEMNASGFYYGLNRFLPGRDILKLYREMNGEIITFGSDAHQSIRLGEYYDESIDLLKSLGFRYIATFTDMEPEFHRI